MLGMLRAGTRPMLNKETDHICLLVETRPEVVSVVQVATGAPPLQGRKPPVVCEHVLPAGTRPGQCECGCMLFARTLT